MAIVFDLETVGESWEKIDQLTKLGLIKSYEKKARNQEEKLNAEADAQNGLGLSPFTGEIITIGMFDTNAGKGAIMFQSPDDELAEFEEGDFKYIPLTEKQMLAMFWNKAKLNLEFVTYNGRGFDVPYLLIRSIVHKIKPTIDLMSNRYINSQYGAKHYDLQDLLTFYGATNRVSLHLVCRAFGITSPKTLGVDGDDVNELFQNKRYLDIARYNAADVLATKELFSIYRSFLS